MNDRDVTHLMFAYSVRKAGNPELYKAFDKKLESIAHRLDYPSLSNALYYMMFRENNNKSIWEQIVKATVENKDILPIIYYRPFKASELFIKHHFPEWNLDDYKDKFWHPERYYNILPLELVYDREAKYLDFKKFLNAKCFVYPTPFMTLHNLFLIHYCFFE